jgi:hypothetical protein
MTNIHQLYDTDCSEWARRNAELLRSGDFSAVDIEHLLEELSDMGKRERRDLENRLTVLIAHLLKWQYELPELSERSTAAVLDRRLNPTTKLGLDRPPRQG